MVPPPLLLILYMTPTIRMITAFLPQDPKEKTYVGTPLHQSDHFFDTAEYHKNGNTPVLPSPQYWLILSVQTYYLWMKRIANIPNPCLICSVDSLNRQNISSRKRKIAYSSKTVTVADIALN